MASAIAGCCARACFSLRLLAVVREPPAPPRHKACKGREPCCSSASSGSDSESLAANRASNTGSDDRGGM
eukprot:8669860-Alexandrium_andersonii.AAC.1